MTDFEVLTAWISARLRSGEEGQTMVEYGLVIALIALVTIALVAMIGTLTGTLVSIKDVPGFS